MSGRITLWGAGELISSFFSRKTAPPTEFYLAAIRTIPPTPYVSGSELDEPTDAGYVRAAIPNDTLNWSNAGQIQVTMLSQDVSFVAATGDWGVIKYWALCNAVTGGYAYFVGTMEAAVTVSNGDALVVGSGDLAVTVGPFFTSEDS